MIAIIPQPHTLLPALQDLADQASEYALHSKSDNTIRAYQSDWKHFTLWCESNGFNPLPASGQVLALYLTAFAHILKVATLSRHLCSIGEAHRTAKLASPTESTEAKLVWQGIRREIGVKQTAKSPILTDDLRRAFASFRQDLKGRRDHALLLLGFATACRRSEIVALDVSDLQFVPEGIMLTIRHSKTDQESQGQLKAVPFGSSPELCPVRATQDWLSLSGISEGALFRTIGKGNRLLSTRLSDKAVSLIVKDLIEKQGGNSEGYSGHSLRSGFITQSSKNGASDYEIMAQSGHKSRAMISRYVRSVSIWQNNSVTRLGL